MALPIPWYGANGTIKIGTPLVAGSASGELDGTNEDNFTKVTGTDFTGEITEIAISGAEADADVLNFVGTGQAFDEKRPTLVVVELTKAHKGEDWYEFSWGTSVVGATGFTTVVGADQTGNRTEKAIAVRLVSGTAEVNWLFNNAIQTKPPEVTISNEGFIEDSVTWKCLVANTRYQEKIG